jgi:NitT/TauT family transport system ATP-binding protein
MPGGATTAAADPIILEAIGKRYETATGAVQAVHSVSLTVRAEEFVTLLGPSGCGKSTVLGMIAGLVRPDAGRVLVAGVPREGPSPEQVALVFQDGGLFPWRTALDNVTFGLELRGVPAAKRREIALGLLEPMGLRGFERKYPRELSGGMRQWRSPARSRWTRRSS